MRFLIVLAALSASSVAVATALATPAAAMETVAVPHFSGVGLRGGGSVRIVPGAVQRVIIRQGSTAYSRIHVNQGGSLEIENCYVRCPSNYRLEVEIQTPRLDSVAIAGGGSIVAQRGLRTTSQLSAAIQGGGSIDFSQVPSNEVSAAIQGGGRILVAPRDSLSGAVSGGGLISYSGNPRVSSVVNGGGSIQRQ